MSLLFASYRKILPSLWYFCSYTMYSNLSEKLEGHQTNQRAELVVCYNSQYQDCRMLNTLCCVWYCTQSACRALESAIGQGLKSVEVKTDSMYTIRGMCTVFFHPHHISEYFSLYEAMTEWVGKWKRNGWQTVNCEEVKNKEDIQRLDNLCQQIDVKWVRE